MISYAKYNWNHAPGTYKNLKNVSEQVIQLYNKKENIPRSFILIHFSNMFFDREYNWTKGCEFPGFISAEMPHRRSYILIHLQQQLVSLKLEYINIFQSLTDSFQRNLCLEEFPKFIQNFKNTAVFYVDQYLKDTKKKKNYYCSPQ